ncbi:MAG: citrate synthase [Phycisphaerae bacterium]
MNDKATIQYNGKAFELPIIGGTEKEMAIDIAQLRAQSGLITLDDGYANTGSCESAVTFIDGERGILRYRGLPIEELAAKCSFVESAYLLMFGELPTRAQLERFDELMGKNVFIHEKLRHQIEGFPSAAPPMAILSAMVNAAGCHEPLFNAPENGDLFLEAAARVMSRIRTIAAASFKISKGRPIIYPRSDLSYTGNFLHMLFSRPYRNYEPDPAVIGALDQIFVLHADHEQNCSTSTVRMVASSLAPLHACISAGICALWGPLHGGANVAVIDMLEQMRGSGDSAATIISKVKQKDSKIKLMGFGHRVYKNFDPRATIIKHSCDTVLARLGIHDPLLDLAKQLEEAALKDPYFVERKLYPNVDFYSGIIMRAIGIPTDMFTVIFAIGRTPGWMAHWREVRVNAKGRIYRPRQVYSGQTERHWKPIDQRA